MTRDDIPLGMRLKEQAGWSQTQADWRRFLDFEPSGCFLAAWDGVPVATTITCIFGPVAWIAMVLVDQAYRGRGIATALMRHALAFLENQGVHTIRLDATPLGQPIYEKLGFVAEYRLIRYEGTARAATPTGGNVNSVEPSDWEHLLDRDREITGTDRRKLLDRMLTDCPGSFLVVRKEGKITGYLAGRPGTKAYQIGPCLATPESGPLLFTAALHRHSGKRVFIDVPEGNAAAIQFVESAGLTEQRLLLRMRCGEPVNENLDKIWASSGPEKG
jgi:ribosomal protein S18 acetylase RimI-like enzyme